MNYTEFKKAANSYKNQDWFRNTQGGNQGLMTEPEAARRFGSVPVSGSGLFGASYENADKSIVDTANQYKQYLKWRIDNKKNLPDNFNYQTYQYNNKTYGMLDLPSVPKSSQVDATLSSQPQPKQPNPQIAQQKPSQSVTQTDQQGVLTRSIAPMGVGANRTMQAADIAPDPNKPVGYSVTKDALKDPESVKKFLESVPGIVKDNTSFAAKADSLGYVDLISAANGDLDQVPEADKVKLFQKFKEENPNFVPSLAEAVKNGSPEAIEELQKLASGKDGSSYFTEDEMKQITGAAKTASWNAIKEDWFTNLPKVASLFLRHIGLGDTIADFAKNPLGFYGGLLALLFGGGALLSGGPSNKPTVVNNYYGQQQPKGYNIVPYA